MTAAAGPYIIPADGLSAHLLGTQFWVTNVVNAFVPLGIVYAYQPLGSGGRWALLPSGITHGPGSHFPYGALVEPDRP